MLCLLIYGSTTYKVMSIDPLVNFAINPFHEHCDLMNKNDGDWPDKCGIELVALFDIFPRRAHQFL